MSASAVLANASVVVPFYSDWTFWSSAIALVALAFSIGPLIWRWLMPPKLTLELYDRIALSHKIGYPTLQAHFVVRNSGGREARVSSVVASISRDGGPAYALPARTYLIGSGQAGQQLLFSPFTLGSRAEWANIVNFFATWPRDEEQRYREYEYALKSNIIRKLSERPPGNNVAIYADDALVSPLLQMFEHCGNKWQTGQYELILKINTVDLH